MIGPLLRILVVGLVLLVAAMVLLPRDRRPPAATPATEVATVLPQRLPLPDVALTDHAGARFTTADMRDGYRLLFFGFTHCPDICPLTLQVLATVQRELDVRAPELKPQVVFVSVDPRRDDPQRLRDYLGNFDAEFVGVTGPEEALEPLLRALGVTVHTQEIDGERYNVIHNGTVFVVGPGAEVVAIFGGSAHDADAVVSDYLRIRRGADVAAL